MESWSLRDTALPLLENDLEPIDEPKIEIVQAFEDEKPFIFKAEVEVLASVQLGEYKGLKVEKIVPVVTAEDVERELQTLRSATPNWWPEKQQRGRGDFAVIDFDGYIDGRPSRWRWAGIHSRSRRPALYPRF